MTVAVIGLGSIGLRHATNLLGLGVPVIGFDPDPERRALVEKAGGAGAGNRQAAFEGARAAVIASPNACHGEDMAAAVAAGCHVFVEKPLAHAVAGIEETLVRAEEKNRAVFVAHNLRFHPCVEAAREALARGSLGDLLWARLLAASYLPDWRPHQDYRRGFAGDPATGGAIFDFIHEFDLAAYLLGPFETVAASARRTGTLDIEAEDCVDAILRHPGGVRSALHVDYVTKPPRRVTEIAGTGGALTLDIINRRFTHTDANGEEVAVREFGGRVADDYIREMKDFLDCIESGAKPRCDGWEALAILEQVIAARAMAKLPAA